MTKRWLGQSIGNCVNGRRPFDGTCLHAGLSLVLAK